MRSLRTRAKNFACGMGSILDLQIGSPSTLFAPQIPTHSDAEALHKDWCVVGDAIADAIQAYGENHGDGGS